MKLKLFQYTMLLGEYTISVYQEFIIVMSRYNKKKKLFHLSTVIRVNKKEKNYIKKYSHWSFPCQSADLNL